MLKVHLLVLFLIIQVKHIDFRDFFKSFVKKILVILRSFLAARRAYIKIRNKIIIFSPFVLLSPIFSLFYLFSSFLLSFLFFSFDLFPHSSLFLNFNSFHLPSWGGGYDHNIYPSSSYLVKRNMLKVKSYINIVYTFLEFSKKNIL